MKMPESSFIILPSPLLCRPLSLLLLQTFYTSLHDVRMYVPSLALYFTVVCVYTYVRRRHTSHDNQLFRRLFFALVWATGALNLAICFVQLRLRCRLEDLIFSLCMKLFYLPRKWRICLIRFPLFCLLLPIARPENDHFTRTKSDKARDRQVSLLLCLTLYECHSFYLKVLY